MLNQLEQQEPVVRPGAAQELRTRLEALERENGQLREALESRIVIEQAKGVLAERFGLDMDEAFELLRGTARSERRRLRQLAAEVVGGRRMSPPSRALATTRERARRATSGVS